MMSKTFRSYAVAAMLALRVTGGAAAATHPLNVEDMLGMERIERFEIGAGGNLVLFEKHGPKEGFSDYGIDDPSAVSRIYVYERKTGTTRRLLEKFAFPNWIGALSPDGGKIAFYWLENDRVHAGIVDLVNGALLRLSLMPVYDFQLSAPIWISNDALVYSVDPDGEYSTRIDFRRRAALLEREGQDRTWKGVSATVVLENHAAGFVPGWRPGSLVRVDSKTGKTDKLAEGHYAEMVLSPDGRFLTVARQGHYRPFAADSGRQTFDTHRLEPFVLDLEHPGTAVAMCDQCQIGGIGDFAWGPSGHRVSFFARFGDEPWERARFRIYDVDTKKLTEIRHVGLDLASQREVNGGLSAPVTAIPFADGALVPARRQTDTKAAPIFTTKEPVSAPRVGLVRNDYKATLGRLDWYFVKPDGTSRVLTAPLSDVQPSAVATDATSLYFMGGNTVSRLTFGGARESVASLSGIGMAYRLDGSIDTGGRAIAVSVDAQGSRHVQFFEGRHQTTDVNAGAIGFPLAVDAASGTAVFENASATGSVFTLVDRDGHVLPIVEINSQLAQVAPARTVVLKYTVPSGEAVQGCLLLPADAPADKPLPTIVSVYPTEPSCHPLWRSGIPSTYDEELFTGMGYAVLKPSTPARLLKEGDNPTAHWGSLVEAAVNAAVAQGYTDKSRLGLYGMSLGGHSALSTLSQTPIFRAGVAVNGAADFFSHYASLGLIRIMLSDDLFSVGQATLYEAAADEGLHIGATPWDRPDLFAAASPLLHAGQMNTPLLLMTGDLDWNYQSAEFEQYYVALVRQGKEATYVRYLGEGHGNTTPANVRDAWRRIQNWFATHIK